MRIRGSIFALLGNIHALEQNARYIDADLNRLWTTENLSRIYISEEIESATLNSEEKELLALVKYFKEAVKPGREVFLVDLHTSSSKSSPFMVVGERNEFAEKMCVQMKFPVVIDSPGYFDGALMNYFRREGHTALIFEGGQHGSEEAISAHALFIWNSLKTCGLIERVPKYPDLLLDDPIGSKSIELFYRHAIKPADRFKMQPGFRNFDSVNRGQILGSGKNGKVLSPADGIIFLPLYQSTGEDGFFLGK
jgi:succinylglutamate desuccinylase